MLRRSSNGRRRLADTAWKFFFDGALLDPMLRDRNLWQLRATNGRIYDVMRDWLIVDTESDSAVINADSESHWWDSDEGEESESESATTLEW